MEYRGGYVRLLAVMLGAAIVAFLFARFYLTPKPTVIVEPSGQVVTTTTLSGIEASRANIDTAEAMREKVNDHSREVNDILGE